MKLEFTFTVKLVPGVNALIKGCCPVVLQVTPVVAIAPLVLIWAGLDHAGRAIVGLAASGRGTAA